MEKVRVMFLCAGNSCRSQMAEGWARELAGDWLEIKSAGIDAYGQNESAIKVMAEVGIDISQQHSIRVNGEMLEWCDLIVTLCDYAEEQSSPMLSTHTLKMHMPLPDPVKFSGNEQELMTEFRATREKIKQCVEYMITQLLEQQLVVNGY